MAGLRRRRRDRVAGLRRRGRPGRRRSGGRLGRGSGPGRRRRRRGGGGCRLRRGRRRDGPRRRCGGNWLDRGSRPRRWCGGSRLGCGCGPRRRGGSGRLGCGCGCGCGPRWRRRGRRSSRCRRIPRAPRPGCLRGFGHPLGLVQRHVMCVAARHLCSFLPVQRSCLAEAAGSILGTGRSSGNAMAGAEISMD